MAKNHNTFNKRRREIDKKDRAEEKRAKKRQRKEDAGDTPSQPVIVYQQDFDDEDDA